MKYQAIMREFLPMAMIWKESFAGEYVTWEDARKRVDALTTKDREGYVATVPSVGEIIAAGA